MHRRTTRQGWVSACCLALLTACMPGPVTDAPPPKAPDLDQRSSMSLHGTPVRFEHDIVPPIAVGETASLNLTVYEAYPSGTLTLRAEGNAGVSVFGAERSIRKDMADGSTHAWRIDFRGERDGVHYIGVFAEPDLDGWTDRPAIYAIRVEVGDINKAQASTGAQSKVSVESIDNEATKAVIFEAEETITPR